jgi:predicted dehydrogenase
VSERVLKLGLVGLGDIAVKAHLPAIAADPRTELVAVAERDADRLRTAAPPGTRGTVDPAELFDDPAIDAVILATPAAATVELARNALRAGKYVLAEKPIAPTTEQAVALGEVPGALDRLQIGLTYRHHPAIDRLKQLLDEGALGRPLLIQAAICDERADPAGDPEGYARRLRSLERMAPVISDGVHACDRLNLLLGAQPASVTGWSLSTDPAYPSPNVNGGVLTYDDGTVARLEVVWLTPVLPPSQFLVTGPLGRATLDPPTFGLTVELADGRVEQLDPPGDKTEVCFALQLERFVASCLAGTAPVPGFEEALASLELAERIAEAAGVGGAVHA